MVFDYNEYFKILFIGSLFILLIFSLLFVLTTIFLIKNDSIIKLDKKTISSIFSILISFFFIIMSVFSFRHGIHLIYEKENSKIQCTGEITNIRKTFGNNKYVYNGHTKFASYIVINNVEYYIICVDNIEIGDNVIIEYLPNSKVVLSIYVI